MLRSQGGDRETRRGRGLGTQGLPDAEARDQEGREVEPNEGGRPRWEDGEDEGQQLLGLSVIGGAAITPMTT